MNDLQNWFVKLTRKMERLLFRLIATCMAILIVSQALMFIGGFRRFLNRVELIEGVPYLEPGQNGAPDGGKEIELEGNPKLVTGE